MTLPVDKNYVIPDVAAITFLGLWLAYCLNSVAGLMVSGYMTLDLAGIEADNEALDYPRRRDSDRQ